MNWGEGFILWNPLSFGGAIVLICLLLFINYIVQLHFLYKELSHTEDTKIKHISSYKFLDRYGNVGEYMRLELKMFFRNKAPRSQFWGFIFIMCMFAIALASDVYGDSYMNNFICLYCYCILGLMTLNRIMTFEGNYIDGLMVRKESLYNMLPRQILPAMYLSGHPFPVQPYPGLHGHNSSAYVDSLSMFYNGNHICHDDANGSLQQQDCISQHQYHR